MNQVLFQTISFLVVDSFRIMLKSHATFYLVAYPLINIGSKIKTIYMKKIVFLIAMITAAYVSNAQTQPSSSSETYRNIYKVSASMFTRNTFQMGFEHFFTPTTSLLTRYSIPLSPRTYHPYLTTHLKL